jgi:hypothetical protein
VFGSAPRRRLLAEVLLAREPEEGWTKAELARRVGVSPKGGLDEHVAGLARIGVLRERGGRWRAARDVRISRALRGVLEALEDVPEA